MTCITTLWYWCVDSKRTSVFPRVRPVEMWIIGQYKSRSRRRWQEGTYSAYSLIILLFGVVGNDVGQINEVDLRRARLVLGWATISGFNSRCGNLSWSITNHPGQLSLDISPWVSNGYRPKGGDALWLGRKGRYGSCLVSGKTVWCFV